MKTLLAIIGIVIAFIVISVVMYSGGKSTDSSAPVVAVATAAPTVNLMPTPTIAPDLAYKRIAINHLRNLAEGMTQLGAALKEPRIGESDWALQVTMATTKMQDAHTYLSEAQPPSGLAALHQQLTDATRACSAAADAVYLAIDKLDIDMLLASGDMLGQCNDLLMPAIAALKED